MKKLPVFLSFFFFSAVLTAQVPFNFGIRLGTNHSRLITDKNRISSHYIQGYHAGAFFRFNIKKVYLQPEPYFSWKGARLSYDTSLVNPGSKLTKDIKYLSLDLPVLFGVKLVDLEVFNLRIYGGPAASWIIYKDFTVKVDGDKQDIDEKTYDKSFRDMILAVQAGLGFDVFFLSFDARYEYGLNNLLNTAPITNPFETRYHSEMFILVLGIKFI
jgi:hypothetical protein